MIAWNNWCHVLPQQLPADTVGVKPEETDQTLNVVVDKCVIEFGGCCFQGSSHDAMSWEELEVDSSGLLKGFWVNTEATEITIDEAQDFPGGSFKASDHVLGMRLESNAILDQGRQQCFASNLNVSVEM
jgi:hypothetical protein